MGNLTISKSITLSNDNGAQYPIGFDLYLSGEDIDSYSPSDLQEGLLVISSRVFKSSQDLTFQVRDHILGYVETCVSCEYKISIQDLLRQYTYETQGRLTKTSTK